MILISDYPTIKTDILFLALEGGPLEEYVVDEGADSNDVEIANYYNALASPLINVWIPRMTIDQLNKAIVWSEYEALTVSEQNTYMALTQSGFIDMTDSRTRDGVAVVFSGDSLDNIMQAGQRSATRLEALLSTPSTTGAITAQVSRSFGHKMSSNESAGVLRG